MPKVVSAPSSPGAPRVAAPQPGTPKPEAKAATDNRPSAPSSSSLKDSFLAEVRAGKGFFYNTVVAQAQRIDVSDEAITFTFSPTHRALKEQFNETRPWLESAAEKAAGRRISVIAVQSEAAAPAPVREVVPKADASAGGKRDLKAEAMSSSAVQAMLDVFPAEIRDVEEM